MRRRNPQKKETPILRITVLVLLIVFSILSVFMGQYYWESALVSFVATLLVYIFVVTLMGFILRHIISLGSVKLPFRRPMLIFVFNVCICFILLFIVMFRNDFPHFLIERLTFKDEDITFSYPSAWSIERADHPEFDYFIHGDNKYYLFGIYDKSPTFYDDPLTRYRMQEVGKWSEDNNLSIVKESLSKDEWLFEGNLIISRKDRLLVKMIRCNQNTYFIHFFIKPDDAYRVKPIIDGVFRSFTCVS